MAESFKGNAIAELKKKFRKTPGATVADRMASENSSRQKVDGRTLRRTGRTEQLAVRVTAETKAAFQAYADTNGILMAEVLERALTALNKESN